MKLYLTCSAEMESAEILLSAEICPLFKNPRSTVQLNLIRSILRFVLAYHGRFWPKTGQRKRIGSGKWNNVYPLITKKKMSHPRLNAVSGAEIDVCPLQCDASGRSAIKSVCLGRVRMLYCVLSTQLQIVEEACTVRNQHDGPWRKLGTSKTTGATLWKTTMFTMKMCCMIVNGLLFFFFLNPPPP